MDPSRLNENSEACVPAFAFVATGPDSATPGRYEPLDVTWVERHWPLPSSGERIVRWYTCLAATARGAVDDEGFPVRTSSRGAAEIIEVFDGAGIVLLTDRRILGILIAGRSPVGTMDGDVGQVVMFSVPFEEVREITLVRERRTFGIRPRNLTLALQEGGSLALDLDRALDEQRDATRFDHAALLDELVTLAATRIRTSRIAEQTHLIERALSGERLQDGLNLTAVLGAPADERSAPREASGASVEVATPAAADEFTTVPPASDDWAPRAPQTSCPGCGAAPRPGAKFCHDCGHPLPPKS